MGGRTAQAVLLVAAILLSTGTAFGLGSKGEGMNDKKDTGMMQENRNTMEKQSGSMQTDTSMMDETKTKQDGQMQQKGDTMNKGAEMNEGGMKQKDTMGTKDMTPMR